jgi:hypothetical protein
MPVVPVLVGRWCGVYVESRRLLLLSTGAELARWQG